jgi:hypothetical protein
MSARIIYNTDLSGKPPKTSSLCNSQVNGSTILCNGGDITKECSGYTFAFNSRSCRTYCSDTDSGFCRDSLGPLDGESLSEVLVCDRALAS